MTMRTEDLIASDDRGIVSDIPRVLESLPRGLTDSFSASPRSTGKRHQRFRLDSARASSSRTHCAAVCFGSRVTNTW